MLLNFSKHFYYKNGGASYAYVSVIMSVMKFAFIFSEGDHIIDGRIRVAIKRANPSLVHGHLSYILKLNTGKKNN